MSQEYNGASQLVIQSIKKAPDTPGVYKFCDPNGEILYIGKAKHLKKRLMSYLRADILPHTKEMVRKASQVHWHLTKSELEALFLEAELIEKQKPLYNIQHKYGKSYTYITLTKHKFPRLTYKNRWSANSFGPFFSNDHIKKAIDGLHYAFKLRSCTDHVFKSRKRPCLEYDLGRCSAPCVNLVSGEEYNKNILGMKKMLLKGDQKLTSQWEEDLENAIIEEKYELASNLDKRLKAFEIVKEQLPEEISIEQGHIFIETSNNIDKCIYVCAVKDYRIRHKIIILTKTDESLDDFILRWIVKNEVSPIIYTLYPLEDQTIQALNSKNLETLILKASRHEKLLIQVQEHSSKLLKQEMEKANELADFALKLKVGKLNKVEIYDNSHMSGKWNVGVKVVWSPSGFLYSEYEVFHFKQNTNDDYWMMQNVFKTRFDFDKSDMQQAVATKSRRKHKYPDLVIIDGGVGQLSVSTKYIPVTHYALSKHEEGDKLHTINGQGNFEEMQIDHKLRLWLMKLRDEAHRYAVHSHSKLKEDIENR